MNRDRIVRLNEHQPLDMAQTGEPKDIRTFSNERTFTAYSRSGILWHFIYSRLTTNNND